MKTEKCLCEADEVLLVPYSGGSNVGQIANPLLYSSGGPRITANFAGMQASCGDVTVVPILKNMVNFSVGCYGCRSAGKLADDEMYVGIPYEKLSSVVSNLKGLRKAMFSLEKTEVIKK